MYLLITVISDVLKVSASLFGTELFVVSMRSSRYFIKSYWINIRLRCYEHPQYQICWWKWYGQKQRRFAVYICRLQWFLQIHHAHRNLLEFWWTLGCWFRLSLGERILRECRVVFHWRCFAMLRCSISILISYNTSNSIFNSLSLPCNLSYSLTVRYHSFKTSSYPAICVFISWFDKNASIKL